MSESAKGQSKRRRWGLILGALGLVVAVGVSWLVIAKPFAPKHLTAEISRRILKEAVEVSGTVEARRMVTLKAEAMGPLTARPAEEGKRVPAGSLLLQIAPATARLQLEQARRTAAAQAAQARTELAGAELALNQATTRHTLVEQGLRNDLSRVRTALAQTEQDARTSQALIREEAVSRQSAEQVQTQLLQARIALRTATDALGRAQRDRTEIVAAQNRLAAARTTLRNAVAQGGVAVELAAEALAKTSLKAPFAGSVTEWLVNLGDYVAPGTPLGTFQDLAELRLKLPVDETDLGKMRLGGAVTITFDAFPERAFPGRIATIGAASVKLKDVMVFPVEVRFANPESRIRPGMSGDADILVQERSDAVAVPLAAVTRDQGKYFVKVLRGKETVETAILPGIITLEYIEALTGLQPGDLVVLPALTGKGGK